MTLAPPPTETKAWLGLAEAVAREAGTFLRDHHATQARVTSEAVRDVKLAADVAAETRIIERLRAASPFAILSEERGVVAGSAAAGGWRWILDPLDGSVNYLMGIPFCAVSLALWDGERPVLGVIYDFNRDELFAGIVDGGATVNGAAVRVTATTDPARAVLCTGFPSAMDHTPATLGVFIERLRAFRKVRLLGSAALALAYVAAGRADAYVEQNINLWDVAAGVALVRAAGGVVVTDPAPDGRTLIVYAGTPGLPPLGRGDAESSR